MALLKESEMIALGKQVIAGRRRKAESIVTEDISTEDFAGLKGGGYDIFLSHSYLDKEAVYGVKRLFEGQGYSVFIDWLEDELSDRDEVDGDTARELKQRMYDSRCLLYATSSNSQYSKWMPWECGYADGAVGRVAIAPLVKSHERRFEGQEYLGMYPYIDQVGSIFVNAPSGGYCTFEEWLNGETPGE